MKKRLIVNADDFGLCEGVNKAVERSHKEGILTSATIMAGFDSTQRAIEMAKGVPKLGVGVHLNLTEGKAVCQNEDTKYLLDDDGGFKYSAGKVAIKSLLCGKTRKAIETELTAQVQSLLDMGLKPTHLDSHKHVHTFPTIWPIVVKIAEKFGIRAIRWPCEAMKTSNSDWPLPSKSGKTRTLIISTMARIDRAKDKKYIVTDAFYGVAHTGKADDDFWQAVSRHASTGVSEVMVHPGYADGLDPDKTRLIQQRQVELESLCSEKTKAFIADAGIELINYGEV